MESFSSLDDYLTCMAYRLGAACAKKIYRLCQKLLAAPYGGAALFLSCVAARCGPEAVRIHKRYCRRHL
jgi:hypothetical protein